MKQIYTISSFFIIMLLAGWSYPAQAFLFRSKIDSIQINFDSNQLVLPGESFNITVTAFHKNGKVRKTKGAFGGRVGWWRYELEVQGGQNNGGRIVVNKKLIPSKGKYIGIYVIPKKQPELKKGILIPLNYETKISFHPLTYFDKAPGCSFKGKVISSYNNGQSRVYQNLQKSKIADRFQFSTRAGFWRKGTFTIEPDFHKITDHHSALIVHSILNETASDTFDILLDYKHRYILDCDALSGWDGSFGLSGGTGSYGCNGGDGEHGENGRDGENAPDIGVWADSYYDEILQTDLLYVYAKNFWNEKEHRYLINPNGGSLYVSAEGGSGGDGGHGGRGGNGGRGRDGRVWYETKYEKKIVRKPFTRTVIKKETKKVINSEGKEEEVVVEREAKETYYKDVEEIVEVKVRRQGPGEPGGNGGDGGDGGFGGCGGNGGDIYLYFSEDARKHRNIFVTRNNGGRGGDSGRAGGGGSGGAGGSGNPDGDPGSSGSSGSSPFGWASSGYDGEVFIESCEEFIENTQNEHLSQLF